MEYIASRGLKFTPQRRLIAETLFAGSGHLSSEELYHKLRELDSSIGQATVYRTLKLLCESGLAKEVNFGDGIARFEPRHDNTHHDHLICEKCGKTQEILDENIEKLQVEVAAKYGYTLTSHKMYLYGLCQDCRKAK